MSEPILPALQQSIDQDWPGWTVTHYAVGVGISRINSDGDIETSVCMYYADGQADYVTEGLLMAADRLRSSVDEEQP